MGRYLPYKGKKAYRPGAYPTVRKIPTRRALAGVRGKVLVIGEADEGAPGLNAITDPNTLRDLLGSGPGADACAKVFSPSNDAAVPGGASEVLFYQTNTTSRATLPLVGDEAAITAGTVAAGGSTGNSTQMVVTWTGGGLTANAHVDRSLKVNFGDGRIETRRIFSNAAGDLTVKPGYSSLPGAGLVATIMECPLVLTWKKYGVKGNDGTWAFASVLDGSGVATGRYVYQINHPALQTPEVSDEILGQAALRIKYTGGPAVANGAGVITLAAKNALSGKTEITLDVAGAPAANAFDAKVLQFADGKQRLVESHTALDPAVITLDLAHALTDNEIAALNALQAASAPMSAMVRNVTAATVTIEGSAGVATTMKTTVTATPDDLTLSFSTLGLRTLSDLVSYLNNNTSFSAYVPGGTNGDTTLLSSLDYGSSTGPAGANKVIDVRFDDVIAPLTKGLLKRDAAGLVEYINATSDLVTAARRVVSGAQDGKELPITNTVVQRFQGGARGTSTNAAWQLGFDALLRETGQHLVALCCQDLANEGYGSTATWKSVAAMLRAHILASNETGRKARGGYIGFKGTFTDAQLASRGIACEHVQCCIGRVECQDVAGNTKVFDEWMFPLIIAGCRAGSEIGEPMTWKRLAISAVEYDTTFTPKSDANVAAAAQAGIMFPEAAEGGGFWCHRDITTYIDDDDSDHRIDGNMVEEGRFIADDLPAFVQVRFTGRKLKTGDRAEGNVPTPASVRQAVIERCEQYKASPLWVLARSKDPDDPTGQKIVDGYDRITVTQNGNTMSIDGRFFLTSGIVFIPVGMSFHVPEL